MSTNGWFWVASGVTLGAVAVATACVGGPGDLNGGGTFGATTSSSSTSGSAGTSASSSGTRGTTTSSSTSGITSSSGTTSGTSSGTSGTSGGLPGCRSNAQCTGGQQCIAPGQSQCGGAAPIQQCSSDLSCDDAGAGQYCNFDNCGGATCTTKCTTDGECTSNPSGLNMCNLTTGRCVPRPCTTCPTYFTCLGSAGCQRTTCGSDTQCPGGACVNGKCWNAGGSCQSPPP